MGKYGHVTLHALPIRRLPDAKKLIASIRGQIKQCGSANARNTLPSRSSNPSVPTNANPKRNSRKHNRMQQCGATPSAMPQRESVGATLLNAIPEQEPSFDMDGEEEHTAQRQRGHPEEEHTYWHAGRRQRGYNGTPTWTPAGHWPGHWAFKQQLHERVSERSCASSFGNALIIVFVSGISSHTRMHSNAFLCTRERCFII